MDAPYASLAFGGAAALATAAGGLLVVGRDRPWTPRSLHAFIAVGAGFLLTVALLRMLPEATARTPAAAVLVLVGYLAVHLFEHTLAPHFHFGEETHHDVVAASGVGTWALIGLLVHSLFDGISIGSGFLVSPSLGLLIFSAIVLHKIPEGFTIASIMLSSGTTRKTALLASVAVGVASVVGALGVIAVPGWVGPALALSAGVTLYVAASDLIPEVNQEEGPWMALLVFAGVLLFVLSEILIESLGV